MTPTGPPPWCTVDEHLAQLRTLVAPTPDEQVGLDAAAGRVARADVAARVAIPRFEVSAMDGYAVRHADLAADGPTRLRVVADLAAGSGERPALTPGECARIMTGAAVPPGADTVVPVETTDGGTAEVRIETAPAPGAHIRHPGEDVDAGRPILRAGQLLTPGILGTLAATGHDRVRVAATPRVAVAATGSELVAPGRPLRPGSIHESNSWFVAGALRAAGARVEVSGPIADDAALLRRHLDDLTDRADLVVLTGGAGPGAHDVPGQVVRTAQRWAARRVRMQPGKPQAWAVWNGTPVLVLPGNPVAAAVSACVFARPLVHAMLGARPAPPLRARAAQGWRSPAERTQYLPARLEPGDDGTLLVRPAHRRGGGSHLVSALAEAEVFAVAGPATTQVRPGDVVEILPLPGAGPWR